MLRQRWRRRPTQKLPVAKLLERMKTTKKRRKQPTLHVEGQRETIEMIETYRGCPLKYHHEWLILGLVGF
jgi:hypothetical protein